MELALFLKGYAGENSSFKEILDNEKGKDKTLREESDFTDELLEHFISENIEFCIDYFKENPDIANKLLVNERYLPFMEESQFKNYCQIGRVLELSSKQSRLFACIAMDYDRKKTIEITETSNNSLGSLKRDLGRKLGFNDELQVYKDSLIKELAQELENTATLDAAKKVYQSSIREKIEVAKEYAENKRIADMVRANPELLQMYEQMNQSQND